MAPEVLLRRATFCVPESCAAALYSDREWTWVVYLCPDDPSCFTSFCAVSIRQYNLSRMTLFDVNGLVSVLNDSPVISLHL